MGGLESDAVAARCAQDSHTHAASRMSRRQMVGRVGRGAVAAGVAAWVVPEILIATPNTADAMSAPPGCDDRPGKGAYGDNWGCSPGNGGNGGNGGGWNNGGDGNNGGGANGGGGGGSGGDPPGDSGDPSTGNTGTSSPGGGGGAGGTGTGASGANGAQPTVAAGSGAVTPVMAAASGGPGGPAAGDGSGGSGGFLAFTGFDALQDAEIGTAMVVGGWLLTRWASRARGAGGSTPTAGPPPIPTDE
jgi:hypothetical protein